MTFDGLGVSDYTPTKQENLATILRWHLEVVRCVLPKWGGTQYCYFDLNAGPGRYKTETGTQVTGSPLVFLQAAQAAQIPFRAVLIEQCHESYLALRRNVTKADNIEVRYGNHNIVLSEYCSNHPRALGLVYCDPTNHEVPFTALSYFCRAYPRVDVLIHVAANAIKRTRADDDPDLLSRLGVLNKRDWLAMEPTGKWQWTFLLGTNGGDVLKDYKRIRLYRIDTLRGRDIAERINYTKVERGARQQMALLETAKPTLPVTGAPNCYDEGYRRTR